MNKRFAFAAILLLLFCTGLSWGWYFATRKPLRQEFIAQRPVFPVNPPAWQKASAGQRAAAVKSIVAQLEAFKKDNYELAVKYQSRALKANFASTENFREMMQNSYPQFAHYRKAIFGAARSHSKGAVVEIPITLTGSDGVVVRATYTMQLEEGQYRVAGVMGGGVPGGGPPPDPDFDALPV